MLFIKSCLRIPYTVDTLLRRASARYRRDFSLYGGITSAYP